MTKASWRWPTPGTQVTTRNASPLLSRCGEHRTFVACRRKRSRGSRQDWNQKKSSGATSHERASRFRSHSEPAAENPVRIVDRFPADSILHRGHVVAHGPRIGGTITRYGSAFSNGWYCRCRYWLGFAASRVAAGCCSHRSRLRRSRCNTFLCTAHSMAACRPASDSMPSTVR